MPNIIELFEMRAESNWASKTSDGYKKLAGVLRYAENLVEDKEAYQKALADLKNMDELADWALFIVRGELDEAEKKQ